VPTTPTPPTVATETNVFILDNPQSTFLSKLTKLLSFFK